MERRGTALVATNDGDADVFARRTLTTGLPRQLSVNRPAPLHSDDG